MTRACAGEGGLVGGQQRLTSDRVYKVESTGTGNDCQVCEKCPRSRGSEPAAVLSEHAVATDAGRGRGVRRGHVQLCGG